MKLPLLVEMTSPAALNPSALVVAHTPESPFAAGSLPEGAMCASHETGQTTGSFATLMAENGPVDIEQRGADSQPDDPWGGLPLVLAPTPAGTPPPVLALDLAIIAEYDPENAGAGADGVPDTVGSNDTVSILVPQPIRSGPAAGMLTRSDAVLGTLEQRQPLAPALPDDLPPAKQEVASELAFAARLHDTETEAPAAQPETTTRHPERHEPAPAPRPAVRTRAYDDPAPPRAPLAARESAVLAPAAAESWGTAARSAEPRETRAPAGDARPAQIELTRDHWSESSAPGTAREISLRVADHGRQPASVRLVERSGELLVSVRTADPQLTQSLRGELDQLVRSLQDTGFRTEVWKPAAASSSMQNDAGGRESYDEPRQHAKPDGDSGHSQRRHGKSRPRWVEELEESSGR